MRRLIATMAEALKKQPNVNKTIKEGLPALVEKLEELEDHRRPLKRVHTFLEGPALPPPRVRIRSVSATAPKTPPAQPQPASKR
ncbi:hypothetical protein KPH14_013037, partial [Odynerus spinipes]